jgi:uncharacterized protein YprB with RNaseH-like and TPR domain
VLEAYLDIETSGLSMDRDSITVVGIYLTDGANSRFTQFVGEEITTENLLRILHNVDVVYTYNGSRFDIPFINAALGIDLGQYCRHHDLMLDCWRCNLYGGFKAVEARLGISRELKGINGWEAVRLWWRYQMYNDRDALDILLSYNREDVVNLKALRETLGIG